MMTIKYYAIRETWTDRGRTWKHLHNYPMSDKDNCESWLGSEKLIHKHPRRHKWFVIGVVEDGIVELNGETQCD